MLKAYKYELRPTKEQIQQMNQIFGNVRFVYNWALEKRTTAYQQTGKSPSSFQLMKQLTELKKEDGKEWLSLSPIHSLQKSILRLDASFQSFFSKKGKYPRFKGRKDFKQSFQIPDKNSIKVDFDGWTVNLPKLHSMSFNKDRKFNGEIRQATISKTSTGRHFISILVDDGGETPNKKEYNENNSIGIDVGIKDFAVLSDGTKIPNPKYLEKKLKLLRVEQRSLQRKQKEGKNRDKQKLVVAKLHEKVSNQRKDFLHKLSTAIAKQYVGVCVEELNIQGMMGNKKIARHIGQCGWFTFKTFLGYKLDWNGGSLIEIGKFEPSSKTCHKCGAINQELKLSDREWGCKNCNAHHDRDLNASLNIKFFGLRTQPFSVNGPVAVHC
jgi:putative transposase